MPTTNKLCIEYKNIDDLIPYARNSKIHDEQNINLIAGSIKSFGFNNPVLLDGENGIIAGHGRVLAAQKLGYKEVPCIELNGMTEAEKRAYIIADNKLTEKSKWDKEVLGLELSDLKELGMDLNQIGFDNSEINNLLNIDDSEFSVSPLKEGGELDLDSFDEDKFQHKCPRCGMLFNDNNSNTDNGE